LKSVFLSSPRDSHALLAETQPVDAAIKIRACSDIHYLNKRPCQGSL
jgi:hypothetical protein